jgi:hypothetical protein
MARLTFRNPGFMASPDLQPLQITPLNYCTSAKGVFDDTTPQQMQDAMAEYIKVSHDRTLALFFHGGLVDKATGMTNAKQLFGPYSLANDPNEKAGNAYPYFFVWESGLLETLQHNLPGIVSETIFQRLRDIIGAKAQTVLGAPAPSMAFRAPTVMPNIPARAARALSPQDISDVEEAVESDPIINAEKYRIAQSARPPATALAEAVGTTPRQVLTSPATLLSPEIVGAIVAEEAHKDAVTPQSATELMSPLSFGTLALAAGSVLMRIVQRYAAGRNHDFHNTVVEEIFRQYYIANVGWAVWNEMKVETAEAFQGDAEHNVGTAMIAQLIRFYEMGADPKQARITLLGHSTGAVYICNFLAAMDQALASKDYVSQIKFDVIFMAPAVRVDLFAATVAAHGHLIRNFRSFEMSNGLEAAEILLQVDGASPAVNELLGQIYTSSLLYFISGVLEDPDDDTPIDGMQRFFLRNGAFAPGAFADIDSVWSFYGSRSNPVIASDTGELNPQPPLGQRCTSHHHGGFPSDDVAGTPGGTLQSVCYLLRTADY